MRLMELADELGVSTRAVKATCEQLGIDAAWAGAEISEVDAARIREAGVREPDAPVPFAPAPTPYIAAPAPEAPPLPPGFGPSAALPTVPLPPYDTPVGPPSLASTVPGPVGPTPFGANTPPPVLHGITMERSRHPTVSAAWGEWWRGVFIWGATAILTFVIAGLMGVANTFADAYRYRDNTLSMAAFAPVGLVYVGGTAYATLTWIRSGSTALDAWDGIESSGGRHSGKLSIVFILVSVVLACVALLGNVVQFGVVLFS